MVARQPRVGIVSQGDEVVPPEAEPGPGQVRDINSYTLAGLVGEVGGIPLNFPIAPDTEEGAGCGRAAGIPRVGPGRDHRREFRQLP